MKIINLKKLSIVFYFDLAMLLASCGKDNEAPQITVVSPKNHTSFEWKEEIHLVADFKDNENLASFKVYIGDKEGNDLHSFHFSDESTISGTTFNYHEHVYVPAEAEMMYYIHFEVKDEAGNLTKEKVMIHTHE